MTPQPHRSKWEMEEETFLHQFISNQRSLEEIQKTISLRTAQAILKRAHELGYSSKYNKDTARTYFYRGVKKKKRRTKEEMIKHGEYIPTDLKKPVDTHIKLIADIVAKIKVNVNDLDGIIALHQEIIAPHQNIIAQLEKIKSKSWEH